MGSWPQEVRTPLTGADVRCQQLKAVDRVVPCQPSCAVQKVVTGPDEGVASSVHQER